MPPASFSNTPFTPGLTRPTTPVTKPVAASYYFSLLGQIGPATISGYAGVFPMLSWSRGGAGQPGTTAGSGQSHSLNIQRRVDSGSPFLFQACASGKVFPQVTVLSVSQGKTTMRAKLANVVIGGYATVNGGSGSPTESMTLIYVNASFF